MLDKVSLETSKTLSMTHLVRGLWKEGPRGKVRRKEEKFPLHKECCLQYHLK